MKNINKFVCMVAAFISILVLSGCGKSVVLQDDMSGYVNGMKLVDLRDAGSYYANGEKMAALYSTAMDTLWNLDTDSSDKVAFVGQKTSWSLKGSYYEQAVYWAFQKRKNGRVWSSDYTLSWNLCDRV